MAHLRTDFGRCAPAGVFNPPAVSMFSAGVTALLRGDGSRLQTPGAISSFPPTLPCAPNTSAGQGTHKEAHIVTRRRSRRPLRSSRKLLYVILLTASLLVAFAAAALPSASADACTITVTVVGGKTYTFNVNVPPGTPISNLNLPITGVVVSETETCTPDSSSSSR